MLVFYQDVEHKISATKNEKYSDFLQRVITELEIPPALTPSEETNVQDPQADQSPAQPSAENPQAAESHANTSTPQPLVSLQCARLRSYSSYYKYVRIPTTPSACVSTASYHSPPASRHAKRMAQEPYDLQKLGHVTLGAIPFPDYKSVCIETRRPEEEWPIYDPNAYSFFVVEYDPDADDFRASKCLRLNRVSSFSPTFSAVMGFVELLRLTNASQTPCRKLLWVI